MCIRDRLCLVAECGIVDAYKGAEGGKEADRQKQDPSGPGWINHICSVYYFQKPGGDVVIPLFFGNVLVNDQFFFDMFYPSRTEMCIRDSPGSGPGGKSGAY